MSENQTCSSYFLAMLFLSGGYKLGNPYLILRADQGDLTIRRQEVHACIRYNGEQII